eukprot:Partr_v1_DN24506_c0_g1_i2_m19777 putative methyltransferase like 16
MDFAKLALKYPCLERYIYKTRDGRHGLNFRDSAAVRALNVALFAEYHGLALHIPERHLCPAPDSRLAYVKWVESLVLSDVAEEPCPVTGVGLDIGTGVCAIYPLLICSRNPGIDMICTGTDPRLRFSLIC